MFSNQAVSLVENKSFNIQYVVWNDPCKWTMSYLIWNDISIAEHWYIINFHLTMDNFTNCSIHIILLCLQLHFICSLLGKHTFLIISQNQNLVITVYVLGIKFPWDYIGGLNSPHKRTPTCAPLNYCLWKEKLVYSHITSLFSFNIYCFQKSSIPLAL